MGKFKYDLLPKQKIHKSNLNVEIDVYPYTTELLDELKNIKILNRLKEVPQLGTIKVSKKLIKTRYDYIMLQLYLHQLVKGNLKRFLKLTYNNRVKEKEFSGNYKYVSNSEEPTIGDVLQILTIVYNIGHFYNTFTASRAIVMEASENELFFHKILEASDSERFKKVADNILSSRNYQRLHLLNSILILEKCDQNKQSVLLALEILYAYINEALLPEDCKLKYVFKIFQNVRTISYMAYDLQIAKMPLTIDLCDKQGMLLLLKEILSEYNNHKHPNYFISSITKLLDDTVYNENSNAICYYKISRRMVSLIDKELRNSDEKYYEHYFLDKNSALNGTYSHKRDYDQEFILKVTFLEENRGLSMLLLSTLEKINNIRVGYYDRHSGEQTILVSIKKNCDIVSKTKAAFKVMQCTVKFLRRIPSIKSTDYRFLLCVKFFLFYLFGETPLLIKPTIDKEKCVICTRGKNARVKDIKTLLSNSIGTKDENHEVEFLAGRLENDSVNDTSIMIPASIIVFKKENERKMSEFDGLILYPMRKDKQIIFLEAKNRYRQPNFAKNCLSEKLSLFSFSYDKEDIKVVDYDAYWEYSL